MSTAPSNRSGFWQVLKNTDVRTFNSGVGSQQLTFWQFQALYRLRKVEGGGLNTDSTRGNTPEALSTVGWIISQEKHTFYALLTWNHNGKNTFYLLSSLVFVHCGPPLIRPKQLATFVFNTLFVFPQDATESWTVRPAVKALA